MSDHTLKIGDRVRDIRWKIVGINAEGSSKGFRQSGPDALHWYGCETVEDLEQEFQARCEASYRYGFEDGKKIGIQDGRNDIQQSAMVLKEMVEKLGDYQTSLLRDADTAIAQLALSVAKSIIHREVQMDKELVARVARESLKLVEDRRHVSIKVHPSDWQYVKDYEGDILGAAHGIKELEIKEDERVSPGGCVLETDSGILDARLDTQLDEIAMNLMEAV